MLLQVVFLTKIVHKDQNGFIGLGNGREFSQRWLFEYSGPKCTRSTIH